LFVPSPEAIRQEKLKDKLENTSMLVDEEFDQSKCERTSMI
jgi:hypothetical protein